MATLDDVREIASQLPGAVESEGRFSYGVIVKGKSKGFLWTWAERVQPKKARVINEKVIAVVVPNQHAKEMLIASDPAVYFTEPHYDGYNAVLVRLEAIELDELREVIVEAWKCKAPTNLT